VRWAQNWGQALNRKRQFLLNISPPENSAFWNQNNDEHKILGSRILIYVLGLTERGLNMLTLRIGSNILEFWYFQRRDPMGNDDHKMLGSRILIYVLGLTERGLNMLTLRIGYNILEFWYF